MADVSASIASGLPAFISEMVFDVSTHDTIDLLCEKITVNSIQYILFSINATINSVQISFVQLSNNTSTDIPVKRLFKVGLEALPTVHDVPVLGQLEQPFDQMDLLWALTDWTKDEIHIINANVYNGKKDQLILKHPAISAPNTDTTIMLMKGVHLLIIAEENGMPTAVLDHNFIAKPATKSTGGNTRGEESGPQVPEKTAETTAVWSKTISPLTISSISMKFEDRKLQLTLDATVKLGPIEAIFRGLGLSFEPTNMQSLSLSSFHVLLSGIGIEMNRPPVVMAGEFLKLANYQYAGGLIVEVEPYTFVAGGYYGDRITNTSPPPATFKSMFVFVAMEGPIATIEFPSLSGLTGGFGYNSQVTMPTVDNVTIFPFLKTSDINSSGDPLAILSDFIGHKPTPWFKPVDGPIWIAAGLTVQMFQFLKISAVVVLDVGADVIFGVLAEATATIPESATETSDQFAFIDMVIVAIYDHGKGNGPLSAVTDAIC